MYFKVVENADQIEREVIRECKRVGYSGTMPRISDFLLDLILKRAPILIRCFLCKDLWSLSEPDMANFCVCSKKEAKRIVYPRTNKDRTHGQGGFKFAKDINEALTVQTAFEDVYQIDLENKIKRGSMIETAERQEIQHDTDMELVNHLEGLASFPILMCSYANKDISGYVLRRTFIIEPSEAKDLIYVNKRNSRKVVTKIISHAHSIEIDNTPYSGIYIKYDDSKKRKPRLLRARSSDLPTCKDASLEEYLNEVERNKLNEYNMALHSRNFKSGEHASETANEYARMLYEYSKSIRTTYAKGEARRSKKEKRELRELRAAQKKRRIRLKKAKQEGADIEF